MKKCRHLLAVTLLVALAASVLAGSHMSQAKSLSSVYKTKYNKKTFRGTSDSVLLQGHGVCTVKFLEKKGKKVVMNIKLYDTATEIYRVNEKVKVKLSKQGSSKFYGSFSYDSGLTTSKGVGKLWLKGGKVYVKLGLTGGQPPLFRKKKLKRVKKHKK